MSGRDAGRYGNGHPNIVPYRTYPAADGELAVAVGNDTQFARFAELLGHPEWATDQRFTRNRDRVAHRDTIDGLIREVLVTKTRSEWLAALDPAGIPAGPINSVAEALGSRQTLERAMVVEVEHPGAGLQQIVGIPFLMFGTPPSVRRPPPMLGEHTEEVLAQIGWTTDPAPSIPETEGVSK